MHNSVHELQLCKQLFLLHSHININFFIYSTIKKYKEIPKLNNKKNKLQDIEDEFEKKNCNSQNHDIIKFYFHFIFIILLFIIYFIILKIDCIE